MHFNSRQRVYRVPESPLARAGLVLLGLAVMAVSFILGLAVLAVVFGLALIGALYIGLMRLIHRFRRPGKSGDADDEDLRVEYRVVERRRRD